MVFCVRELKCSNMVVQVKPVLVTSAQHVSLAPSEVFLFSVKCETGTPLRGQDAGCATQPGMQMTLVS